MNSHSIHEVLKEAFGFLQASSPSELAHKFIEEDQRLLKTGTWDYKNPELVINKVKELVERVVDDGLMKGDKEADRELRDILWFWYHHATGKAIWSYKDKKNAQEFSTRALKYQTADNPNQITRLLYFLVHDQDAEATAWSETITEEPDKTASDRILEEYRAGNFFKP